MEFCHTKKDSVTMDINQCCFYGNIFAILSNFLTYCNITQKLFNQSSSNFQGKEILSSPSLTNVLLL